MPRDGALTRIGLLVASGGGLGLIRPAPGTWGTAGAGLAAWIWAVSVPGPWVRTVLLAAGLLAVLCSLVVLPIARRRWGDADPAAVVIDEMAGLWVALAVLPSALLAASPLSAILACGLLFRCFDILKPGPVSWIERCPGTIGVMGDDMLAGLLAGVCAFAFLH